MRDFITVSQLNRYVKALLEENKPLRELFLKGELSDFHRHYSSGHLYFTLKEGGCTVKGVMFASYAKALGFHPEPGMKVLLRCSVSLYERDGSYQVYAYEMQPDGLGARYLAYVQLKEKLGREGLFAPDKKRPLPLFPEAVAILTSPTGAAVQDMLSILSQRFPAARVLLYPVSVQGEGAAAGMAEALEEANLDGRADVILMGRGGGSAENLWVFNDEALVRAVAASRIPVVSAVGHETDFTLCDFAADARAETPTAAAQMAVPDGQELLYSLDRLRGRLSSLILERLQKEEERLNHFRASCSPEKFLETLEAKEKELECRKEALCSLMTAGLSQKQEHLAAKAALFDALSPLKLLARGYSITEKEDGTTLRSPNDVREGEIIVTRLAGGAVRSVVTGREENNYGEKDHI